MDVCHNLQGFQSVLRKAHVDFPNVKKIKIAMVVSRKKHLDDVVNLMNEHEKVSDIFVISRPHQRLLEADLAHEKLKSLGCTKLMPLISDESKILNDKEEARHSFKMNNMSDDHSN